MNKRKWLVNFILLMSMVVVCFMTSGFYVESCTSSSVTIDGQKYSGSGYIGILVNDEESTSFKAADIENNGGSKVVIYVLNGSTVEIPVTLYIPHDEAVLAENYFVIVGETSYSTTRTERDGASVLMASFTVPFTAQDNSTQTVAFSGSYVTEDSPQEAFADEFQIISVAELPCGSCASTYNEGTLVHEEGCTNVPEVTETVTVYFSNVEGWNQVYAFFWQESQDEMDPVLSVAPNPFGLEDGQQPEVGYEDYYFSDFTAWPGVEMRHVQGTVYAVEIPTAANRILFNNGGEDKTDDLTIPSDGRDFYVDGNWSTMLKITKQPVNAAARNGEMIKTPVAAQGVGLKYQWLIHNANDEEGVWHNSSMTSRVYQTTMSDARANRLVKCVITDAYGNTVTSDIALLERTPTTLEITQQPSADTAVKQGEIYQVTVEAKGDGLKYQWYLKNAGSDQWYESALKGKHYTVTMTDKRAGREIYCVITDAYGNTVESDHVSVTRLRTELAILEQPVDVTVAMGEVATVSVKAQGDGLKYQWYICNEGSTTFSASATKIKTYDITMTRARANRQVYCVITDAYGNTVTSEIATLICPDA